MPHPPRHVWHIPKAAHTHTGRTHSCTCPPFRGLYSPLQAVAGDDTWMQLRPDAYSEAHPYPSFNVKDLHTVDEGVWQVSGGG